MRGSSILGCPLAPAVSQAPDSGGKGVSDSEPDYEPPYLYPDYRATVLRAPNQQLVKLPEGWFHRARGPVFGRIPVRPQDADLTRQPKAEPPGERIIFTGRAPDRHTPPI